MALFNKARTGKGILVSTSLINNGLWANSSMMQAALVGAPSHGEVTQGRVATGSHGCHLQDPG